MFTNLLIIGIGGFFGSIARYLIFLLDRKYYYYFYFPLGTLFVNLVGSLLIGIALGFSIKYNLINRGSVSHSLLVTGFLGGFTTFSTFTQDSFILLSEKQYLFFVGNVLSNVVFGILLVALGYFLVKKYL